MNIPVDAPGFDRPRDGHGGNNVIDAIDKQAKILADKSATKEARAEALKFLCISSAILTSRFTAPIATATGAAIHDSSSIRASAKRSVGTRFGIRTYCVMP